MKRRVFSKTTPFHVKKKTKNQNGIVLNDTVPLSSSPERAAGEERKVLFFCLSLTPHACQNRPPHALS
jgi:hypothetical protein